MGTNASVSARFKWSFTAEDAAWLVLFAVLAICQEDVDYQATIMIVILGLFQILEPKWSFFHTPKGQIAGPLIKTFLCYLLVGWAHGINSNFYLTFLLPIVAAAAVFELLGTVSLIALVCLADVSFLLYVDWDRFYTSAAEIRLFCLRISFYPVVGLAVYQQARAKRIEMARTKAAADQLAESNRSLRKTEVSLRRSERLAALGQLTAGLAHELRNPLGTIKASSEMLNKPATLGKPDVVQELAGYIATEVDRTNALVSRFLDFARPLQLKPEHTDLRQTVEQSVIQARPRAEAKGVSITAIVPSGPLELTFDPSLLTLALTNLLQNAIDASNPGQEVKITLDYEGMGARITVADHGSGIASEHLESIFNPFFTTKVHGTGLGLPLVAKIVDEHEGKVSVRSSAGIETAFEIHLPNRVEA